MFFDKTIFRSMNLYGFPLLIANISAVLLNVIDRFSLNSLALLKYVALYTLAFKITSVLKLAIVDSIKLALGPMMIKRIDTANNKRFYSKVLLYSSFALMFAIVAVSMFSYELIKVMAGSKEFWGAVVIIPVLSISIFFINMKEVTVYGLHIAKKTRIIGAIVVFSTSHQPSSEYIINTHLEYYRVSHCHTAVTVYLLVCLLLLFPESFLCTI